MKPIRISIIIACLLYFNSLAYGKDFPITNFGARRDDSNFNNSAAINKAIAFCHKSGGGRVVIPNGIFRSGTIFLKSNVEIYFAPGAILLASSNMHDFPVQPQSTYRSQKDTYGWRALIFAEEVDNIAITGQGKIDGNGKEQQPDPNIPKGDKDGRPRNLLFISCTNIRIEGISLQHSGSWNQHYLNCEDVIVDNIKVYNHSNRNNDAIDIDGCRRFILSNSILDSDDDGITLKSTGSAPTEDVAIMNCIISSFCNAIKAGTESTGGFRNITVSNCIVKPSRNKNAPIHGLPKGITGISLEITDGGTMEGVIINNIMIEGTACPIYLRLGNRGRKYVPNAPAPAVGKMRNITISNVTSYNAGNYCSSITAIPGYAIENVMISNIQFQSEGNPQKEGYIMNEDSVIEDEKGYPQPTIWGNLPSSAFFIRHAKNIQIDGLMFGSKHPDPRIPIIAVDVDGLQINRIFNNNAPSAMLLKAKKVVNLYVGGPSDMTEKVLQVDN
jgi:polygalacturonase